MANHKCIPFYRGERVHIYINKQISFIIFHFISKILMINTFCYNKNKVKKYVEILYPLDPSSHQKIGKSSSLQYPTFCFVYIW